jgi:hypothetical protein
VLTCIASDDYGAVLIVVKKCSHEYQRWTVGQSIYVRSLRVLQCVQHIHCRKMKIRMAGMNCHSGIISHKPFALNKSRSYSATRRNAMLFDMHPNPFIHL